MKIHEAKSTAAQCKNTDPSDYVTHITIHLSVKVKTLSLKQKNVYKLFCIMAKVCVANICRMRAVCMRMNQCICCEEWPCTCGVCSRSLSCKDIINDLVHTSQARACVCGVGVGVCVSVCGECVCVCVYIIWRWSFHCYAIVYSVSKCIQTSCTEVFDPKCVL